jgi:glycine/D-amino acid oxidase-like deaminating enzyme
LTQTNQIDAVWELSAPPAPASKCLLEDISTDVLIIGAGFSGLSTALHLQDSSHDVVLIDAHSIAWGASGRNGGHVLPLIRKDPAAIIEQLGAEQGERLIRMVAESADLVFSMIERFEIDCDAERNGWLQAIHSAQQLAICENRFQQWQAYAADMAILDEQETNTLMGTEAYIGALLVRSAGHINPLAFARGMAEAARKGGTKLFTDTPALAIEQKGSNWQVKTPKGTITAEKIVLATAAYSDAVWPGLQKSYLPFYLYNVATTPLDADLRKSVLPGRQPVTDTRSDAHVFHYDGAGRLISGGTFIFPYRWKSRLLVHVNKVLSSTFPQIESAQFELDHVWRGKVSMTTDILPHMHVLAPNVFTWLGCNARGIALATRMGAVLADAVNEVPEQDWPIQATKMQGIPAHAFSNMMTSVMLAYYRLRDLYL